MQVKLLQQQVIYELFLKFVGKTERRIVNICHFLVLTSQSMELAANPSAKVNIGVAEMLEVFTNNNQNTNSSDHVQTKSLPTFEKLLLCSLIICMRANKKRICTRAKVNEIFVSVSADEKLTFESIRFSILVDARIRISRSDELYSKNNDMTIVLSLSRLPDRYIGYVTLKISILHLSKEIR